MPPPTLAEEAGYLRQIGLLVGNDDALVAELVRSLVDTIEADLAGLRSACSAEQWEDVRSSVHRLKVSARMLDCRSLVEMSAQVDAAAAEHQAEALKRLASIYVAAFMQLNTSLRSLQ